jgi:hypothetical protein
MSSHGPLIPAREPTAEMMQAASPQSPTKRGPKKVSHDRRNDE